MTRVAIVVEGKTEKTFVTDVLWKELYVHGVSAVPHPLDGNVTIGRLASTMAGLFWSFDSVTSLVDYYGFRNKASRSRLELQAAIDQGIKEKIRRNYDESKVFSYIQKYEFEGLLFSDTNVLHKMFGGSREFGIALREIRSKFESPEEINDHPQEAPSRRLARVIPRYKKVAHGIQIARQTGIAGIRSECPRFNEWISRLESLGHAY